MSATAPLFRQQIDLVVGCSSKLRSGSAFAVLISLFQPPIVSALCKHKLFPANNKLSLVSSTTVTPSVSP